MKETKHKNDTYGDIDARSEQDAGVTAPIPAATVVLLRDSGGDLEVLMLKKNSKITFGGMWVFPGGKIDEADGANHAGEEAAARNAAARETLEEANLSLEPDRFAYFAHWTPPPGPAKRFATWFFAAIAPDGEDSLAIDQGEIQDHAWLSPAQALERHTAGEIDLAPPTWVTLNDLAAFGDAEEALAHLEAQTPKVYQTRVAKRADGVRVAMWTGDAGYESWDADEAGARHRLVMTPDGFEFERDSGL